MALASDESRVPLETQYYARNDLQFLKQWPKLIILSLNFPLILIVFLYVLILYYIILYYSDNMPEHTHCRFLLKQ